MKDWMMLVGVVQGIYFLVTGIWPILHIRSFQAVTGPKTDRWLVKTVGALVAVIGAVLLQASWRGQLTTQLVCLAIACAAALALVDINYALRRVISKIYLLDAIVQIILIAGWIITWVW